MKQPTPAGIASPLPVPSPVQPHHIEADMVRKSNKPDQETLEHTAEFLTEHTAE